jgi:hypothetical protein
MGNNGTTLSDFLETSKRTDLLEKSLNSVFDKESRPYFISDETSMYDITIGYEEKIIRRIYNTYGISIIEEYFRWTVWELLEFISNKEKEH